MCCSNDPNLSPSEKSAKCWATAGMVLEIIIVILGFIMIAFPAGQISVIGGVCALVGNCIVVCNCCQGKCKYQGLFLTNAIAAICRLIAVILIVQLLNEVDEKIKDISCGIYTDTCIVKDSASLPFTAAPTPAPGAIVDNPESFNCYSSQQECEADKSSSQNCGTIPSTTFWIPTNNADIAKYSTTCSNTTASVGVCSHNCNCDYKRVYLTKKDCEDGYPLHRVGAAIVSGLLKLIFYPMIGFSILEMLLNVTLVYHGFKASQAISRGPSGMAATGQPVQAVGVPVQGVTIQMK